MLMDEILKKKKVQMYEVKKKVDSNLEQFTPEQLEWIEKECGHLLKYFGLKHQGLVADYQKMNERNRERSKTEKSHIEYEINNEKEVILRERVGGMTQYDHLQLKVDLL